MTDKIETALSGEEREKRRRRSFWRYLGLAMAASALAGLLSGYLSGSYLEGELPIAVPLFAGVIALVGFVWFSVDYYRRVDELELMDNLWANLIGMHVGVLAIGGWWFLSDIDLVRAPSGIEALFVFVAAVGLSYGLRKLNFR